MRDSPVASYDLWKGGRREKGERGRREKEEGGRKEKEEGGRKREGGRETERDNSLLSIHHTKVITMHLGGLRKPDFLA